MKLQKHNIHLGEQVAKKAALAIMLCYLFVYFASTVYFEITAPHIIHCLGRKSANPRRVLVFLAQEMPILVFAATSLVADGAILAAIRQTNAVAVAPAETSKKARKKRYTIPIYVTLISAFSLVPTVVATLGENDASHWAAYITGSIVAILRCPLTVVLTSMAKVKTDMLNKMQRQAWEVEQALKAKEERDKIRDAASNQELNQSN